MPVLKIEQTLASFIESEKIPLLIEALKIIESGSTIHFTICLIKEAGMLSYPNLVDGFISLTILIISAYVEAQEKDTGWINIFYGKSFNGWKKVVGAADYKIEG